MFLRSLEILRKHEMDHSRYPFSITALKNLSTIEFKSNVSFFVGENGSGKSTLLEAMAYQCGFNTAGGSKNNLYEVDASHSALGDHIRLSWLPKVTNGFFLGQRPLSLCLSSGYYASELAVLWWAPLHEQSHGEAFLALFNHRFGKRRFIYSTNRRRLFRQHGNWPYSVLLRIWSMKPSSS